MILLYLSLEDLTGKKVMRAAEVSFKVGITRSITWASSLGLGEERPEDSAVHTPQLQGKKMNWRRGL